MTRNTIFAPREFYHIYNRGTEKRLIFSNDADHERFTCLLYACNGESPVRIDNYKNRKIKQGRTLLQVLSKVDRGKQLVDLCAYALMPNHFHLIIQEVKAGGISLFMQKLITAYTMYFNKKRNRNGVLFQGKFKASHADDDNYLKYLIAYLHLNPIKLIDPKWKVNGIRNHKSAQKYLRDYRYSSYQDYLGIDRLEKILLNKTLLPEYCIDMNMNFEQMVTDWLKET